jgi:hypothetical protein
VFEASSKYLRKVDLRRSQISIHRHQTRKSKSDDEETHHPFCRIAKAEIVGLSRLTTDKTVRHIISTQLDAVGVTKPLLPQHIDVISEF